MASWSVGTSCLIRNLGIYIMGLFFVLFVDICFYASATDRVEILFLKLGNQIPKMREASAAQRSFSIKTEH